MAPKQTTRLQPHYPIWLLPVLDSRGDRFTAKPRGASAVRSWSFTAVWGIAKSGPLEDSPAVGAQGKLSPFWPLRLCCFWGLRKVAPGGHSCRGDSRQTLAVLIPRVLRCLGFAKGAFLGKLSALRNKGEVSPFWCQRFSAVSGDCRGFRTAVMMRSSSVEDAAFKHLSGARL